MTYKRAADVLDYAAEWNGSGRATSDELKEAIRIAGEVLRNLANQWRDSEIELPNDVEELVLALVNGKPHPNKWFENAYMLARYSDDEGWIVEGYEEWEGAEIKYWMPLPELPEGVKIEI